METNLKKCTAVNHVMKNIKQCFLLFLDLTCTLVLGCHFLHVRLAARAKLRVQKIGYVE